MSFGKWRPFCLGLNVLNGSFCAYGKSPCGISESINDRKRKLMFPKSNSEHKGLTTYHLHPRRQRQCHLEASQDIMILQTWEVLRTAGYSSRWNLWMNTTVHNQADTDRRSLQSVLRSAISRSRPEPRLNIKTIFPGYGDSHVKDKTVARPSYL